MTVWLKSRIFTGPRQISARPIEICSTSPHVHGICAYIHPLILVLRVHIHSINTECSRAVVQSASGVPPSPHCSPPFLRHVVASLADVLRVRPRRCGAADDADAALP